ncbi:glutamate-rich protein 4 [Ochotona curzoniae]|uniref:glutamate-rich protein 4 n=1 Tax=Ochotona curzoniae TaxID=130825 RepID=UPI001B34B76D|nr:glutamate-rich protein 4 [Ochotona curzoniae]
MELWKRLEQAGLAPPGLGPPPRALRGVPPVESPRQTLMSPTEDPGGARQSLLWIWEELENMRRVDVQLLAQLCRLGLEMGALWEELTANVEEEEEEESGEEEEEDKEPQEKQGQGHQGPSWVDLRTPDFEMII